MKAKKKIDKRLADRTRGYEQLISNSKGKEKGYTRPGSRKK